MHPSAQNLMKSNDAMISFKFVEYGIMPNDLRGIIVEELVIYLLPIECVRSCDQKSYLYNERKGGICIKIEFNPQKNISLLQHGRRFFVYSSNMAAVTSCEHTLFAYYNNYLQKLP